MSIVITYKNHFRFNLTEKNTNNTITSIYTSYIFKNHIDLDIWFSKCWYHKDSTRYLPYASKWNMYIQLI